MKKILVTGAAGFIGFHLANYLLARGDEVFGLDSINDYYDVELKWSRLKKSGIQRDSVEYNKIVNTDRNYRFIRLKLEDRENIHNLFKNQKFDAVCHLAAQAGVRYSLENPFAYIESNIDGFMNILEGCRQYNLSNLCYASSSSVYGLNEKYPFSVSHNVDHPVSLYAASKKANELMAHSYSHLYGIGTTGLRFFTVYGPWGRPDMAIFLFTKAILENKPIDVFNNGEMERDFTYIDDIISGIVKVIDHPAESRKEWTGKTPDPGSSAAPYRVYNIGNGSPVKLMDFIGALERTLGKEAQKNMLPLQPGDVPATYADTSGLRDDFGYTPGTDIEYGIGQFVKWYRDYYRV